MLIARLHDNRQPCHSIGSQQIRPFRKQQIHFWCSPLESKINPKNPKWNCTGQAASLQTPSARVSLKRKLDDLVNMDIFSQICATSLTTGQEMCLECGKSGFRLRPLAGRVHQMWFCTGRCSPLSSRWLHHHTGSGLAPTFTPGRQAQTVAGTLNFQCNLHALVWLVLGLPDETDSVFLLLMFVMFVATRCYWRF